MISAPKLVAALGGLCPHRVCSEILFIYDAMGKQWTAVREAAQCLPFLCWLGNGWGAEHTQGWRRDGDEDADGDEDGEENEREDEDGAWDGDRDEDVPLSYAKHCPSHERGQTTGPDPCSQGCLGGAAGLG